MADGPLRRPNKAAYGPESVGATYGVYVLDRLGQFVVIVYRVVSDLQLSKITVNAQVLFVVLNSMLLRDCVIVG